MLFSHLVLIASSVAVALGHSIAVPHESPANLSHPEYTRNTEPLAPFTTRVLEDGTIIKETLPEVVAELDRRATPAVYACGNDCNDKDPLNHVWTPPGGQGNWFRCADDAQTKATVKKGNYTIELRYSARCRSAWTRGIAGFYLEHRQFTAPSGGYLNQYRYAMPTTIFSSETRWTVMMNDWNFWASACTSGTLPIAANMVCSGRF